MLLGVAVLAIVLGACSSDGPVGNPRPGATDAPGVVPPDPGDSAEPALSAPGAVDPGPTDPAAVDPEPVDPVPVDPAPVASPPTVEPSTDADASTADGRDWLPIVLIIGGIILAIVLVGGLFGRSKRKAPPVESPQTDLLTTSQWIHDQLTLELQVAAPAAALQRWALERRRLDDVAIGAQQQFAHGNDPNWQALGQTMSALASALDTNLQLRAQDPPNAQLINESVAVVNRHRGGLAQLIATLWPTVDR